MVEEGVRPDDRVTQDGMEGVTDQGDVMFELPSLPDEDAERPTGPHTPLHDVQPPQKEIEKLLADIHREPIRGTDHVVEQSSSVPSMLEQTHAVHEQPHATDPLENAIQAVGVKIKQIWEMVKAFLTGGPRQPQPMPV
jgi:hypothetical protein